MNEQPRRLHLHLHFRQLDLDTLKFNKFLTELLAFLHILQHILERTRRLPQGHGCITAALEVKRLHQLAKTSGGHDDIVFRHGNIIEENIGTRYAAKTHQLFLRAKT